MRCLWHCRRLSRVRMCLVLVLVAISLSVWVWINFAYRYWEIPADRMSLLSDMKQPVQNCADGTISAKNTSNVPSTGLEQRYSKKSVMKPTGASWREIETSIYAYSAIFHHAYSRVAVLVIARGISSLDNYRCLLQDEHHVTMEVAASVKELPTAKGSHQGYLLLCDEAHPLLSHWVALTSPTSRQPKYLKVIYSGAANRSRQNEIVACIKPFNYGYAYPDRLREFIELSNMFGVKAFTFYNRSMSENVSMLLNKYRSLHNDRIKVKVLPWNIPLDTRVYTYFTELGIANPYPGKITIHDFGQIPSMMDCFLRNMRDYKYILFIDVDELIVPYGAKTYLEIMHGYPKAKVFCFRNTFFKLEFPDSLTNLQDPLIAHFKPLTLLKTRRENKIFEPEKRSKYIVDTDYLDTPGVHIPSKLRSGQTANISPEVALMHHYRWWGDPNLRASVVDTRIMRYKNAILKRLLQAESDGLTWS